MACSVLFLPDCSVTAPRSLFGLKPGGTEQGRVHPERERNHLLALSWATQRKIKWHEREKVRNQQSRKS